jgi:hypothetical protein
MSQKKLDSGEFINAAVFGDVFWRLFAVLF